MQICLPDGGSLLRLEDDLLLSNDPTVTFDEHCLRVYRLKLYGNNTFPYQGSQLLHMGKVSFQEGPLLFVIHSFVHCDKSDV